MSGTKNVLTSEQNSVLTVMNIEIIIHNMSVSSSLTHSVCVCVCLKDMPVCARTHTRTHTHIHVHGLCVQNLFVFLYQKVLATGFMSLENNQMLIYFEIQGDISVI